MVFIVACRILWVIFETVGAAWSPLIALGCWPWGCYWIFMIVVFQRIPPKLGLSDLLTIDQTIWKCLLVVSTIALLGIHYTFKSMSKVLGSFTKIMIFTVDFSTDQGEMKQEKEWSKNLAFPCNILRLLLFFTTLRNCTTYF